MVHTSFWLVGFIITVSLLCDIRTRNRLSIERRRKMNGPCNKVGGTKRPNVGEGKRIKG